MEFLREHSWPLVASVVLHGLLAGILVLMTRFSFESTPPTVQPMPIDAVVVDSQILHAAQRAEAERLEQEQARLRAAADEAAQAAAAIEAAREAKATEESNAAEAADAQRAADAQQDAANEKAAEQQHQADAAREAAAAEARQAEEAQRMADARQAAQAKAAAQAKVAAQAKAAAEAARVADQQAREQREAELKKQLADEEHVTAVESGPLRDQYIARLRNAIQSSWIKPSSAHLGVDCLVEVTQVPGGEVMAAHVTQCNGDSAVRQSIENAVYRASPLPDPPDPALFQRNFAFRFKPND